jgi:Zn-finger nucleic acid-binding protein
MNCPVDGSELRITDRQGIEIDYCPQCRGVWLDRGELDKILERAGQGQPAYRGDREQSRDDRDRERYRDSDRPYRDEEHSRKGRRRSLLDDLFDFD